MKDGLKQREITTCACCGKGIGHNRSLNFYRITIESHVVNLPAVQRQTGLEMMLGSAAIAAVMGPDEPMSMIFDETKPAVLCFDCALNKSVVELAETLRGEEVES